MKKQLSLLLAFIAGGICLATAKEQQTVELKNVGSPIVNLDDVVNGRQYVLYFTANAGAGRHGLVYTKAHDCGATGAAANNPNNRVTAHNNDYEMPEAGTTVETSAIFTVEVEAGENGESRFAFKTVSGKYIDSADRGASTAGDPIHESEEKGWFYITKIGGENQEIPETEADCWFLKSATSTSTKVFVNTGGADGGGLVLYNNIANDNGNSKLKIIPVEAPFVLEGIGEPVTSVEEIADGGQYMIWFTANAGAGRHGLVYTKAHDCGATGAAANNPNNRVTAHNNDYEMPEVGTTVETSAIFTVEVDDSEENGPRFAFKTVSGKYIDSADRGAGTAGDPIHESEEKGWFYLTKIGGGDQEISETDCWFLKSATSTGTRLFVNTGGADGGGLVLYNNIANDNGNSKLKIIPVGMNINLSTTTDYNAAVFSHNFDQNLVAPKTVQVYKVANVSETEAELSEIPSRVIPANEGVVLVGEVSSRANLATTITKTTAKDAYSGNLLVGLPEGGSPSLNNDDVAYYFTQNTESAAVFKSDSENNNEYGANTAYIVLNNGEQNAEELAIKFGNTTGIDSVVDNTDRNAAIYDLFGRRVLNMSKGGIYIINGKKVLVK